MQLGSALRGPWDARQQVFVLAWGAHQLRADPRHLFDAPIFHPHGETFAYAEPMVANAVAALPIFALSSNPLHAFNGILLLTFVGTAFGAYLLVRDLSGSWWAGVVAGTLLAFCSFRVSHLPHLHLLAFPWTPLALWALHRVLGGDGRRYVVAFGAFAVAQILSSFTLGMLMLVAFATVLPVRLALDPDSRASGPLRDVAVAMVVVAAIVAPFAVPFVRLGRAGFTRTIERNVAYSARLADYATPPAESVVWGELLSPLRGTTTNERHLFLGVVGPALALAGLVARRARRGGGDVAPEAMARLTYVLLLGVSVVLSLGPRYEALGRTVPMPYRLLYDVVPGVKSMRVPARLGLLAMLAVTVLAGMTVADVVRWAGRRGGSRALAVAGTSLVALAAADSWIRPGTATAFHVGSDVPEVYRWLARAPRVPTIELPMRHPSPPRRGYEAEYVFYATAHWQPLANGYASFVPPGYWELEAAMASFPSPAAISLLRAMGVGRVVLHGGKLPPGHRGRVVRRARESSELQLEASFGTDVVFTVRR